jgi:hypothetical protein
MDAGSAHGSRGVLHAGRVPARADAPVFLMSFEVLRPYAREVGL